MLCNVLLKIEEEVCLLVWGVLIIDGIEYQAYVAVNIIVFIIIIQNEEKNDK